jgi:alpha-beta hydrolase superfamily lysophospholipase
MCCKRWQTATPNKSRDWGDPQLPPLLVLQGLGAHAHSSDHVAAALADDYRVIVPDLRGHGRSSWAPAYTWQLFLEDALNLITAVGVPQVAGIGEGASGRLKPKPLGQRPSYLEPDCPSLLIGISCITCDNGCHTEHVSLSLATKPQD